MIHVIAEIETTEGEREAFLEEFRKVVPLVLEEAGCIEYGATIDASTGIDRQAPLRDKTVTIVEKWSDVDALRAHLDAEHMAAYRERVTDLVAGATLRILEPA